MRNLENFKLPHEHFAATIIKWIDRLPKVLHKPAAVLAIMGILWVSVVYPIQTAMEGPADERRPDQAFWATLIMFAVSVIANEYLTPKPKDEGDRPSGVGDYTFPTASEGRPIPLLWGRARVDGANVVWYGDVRQVPLKKRIKTGLWSHSEQTIGYMNYAAFQQTLCRGPNVEMKNIWLGDKLIWNGNVTTDTSVEITDGVPFTEQEGGFQGQVEFYTGGVSQPVSSFLDDISRQRILTGATPGAPRYTGTCHIVVREISDPSEAGGAWVGPSINIKSLSVDVQRIPDLFPGQSSGHNAIGSDGDANPVNVLYEYLTNSEWGMGRSPSEIDTGPISSFLTASDTMRTEVNGFSMLLDEEVVGEEFLQELERHMDGVVYRNLRTKKWEIKLAREDYTIGDQPLLDETNSFVMAYTQSSWEDTSNQVQVLYNKREDAYKESFALAQDMANALLQGNGTVTTGLVAPVQMRFPGCKTAELATNLAWRELRSQAYPLARATLQVERDKWDLTLGTVVAWTSSVYEFTMLPMRVVSIDYGTLDDNAIKLELVQDVFYFEEPSFGVPEAGAFVAPTIDLVAYPTDDEFIMEAPRQLWINDPALSSLSQTVLQQFIGYQGRFLVGAKRQGNEYQYNMTADRNGNGYLYSGTVDDFLETGTLVAALTAQTSPVSSFDITAPASVDRSINNNISDEQLGSDFDHLIMIGNELMLITNSSWASGVLTVGDVHRGVMDTTQEDHAIGAKVWFLFMGTSFLRQYSIGQFNSGLTIPQHVRDNATFGDTWNVRLRMSTLETEFSGTVPTNLLSVTQRDIRPYPPSCPIFNSATSGYGTASVEGTGSAANDFGIDIGFWRRSLPLSGGYNEIDALSADDFYSDLDSTTEYEMELRSDPDGSNDLVGTVSTWNISNAAVNYTRNELLQLADITTTLRLTIRTRYDWAGVTFQFGPYPQNNLASHAELVYDFVPDTALLGTYLGNPAANVATNAHVAASTGTYTVNIGAAQSSAAIEYRIGAGAWTSVVAAAATTGTFSATASDSITLRRTVNEAPNPNFVEITFGGTQVAYGVFTS